MKTNNNNSINKIKSFFSRKKFDISDFSTWENCPDTNEIMKWKGKTFLRYVDYQPMTIKEFMDFCINIIHLFDQSVITLEEQNKIVLNFLEKFYNLQTDKEIIEQSKQLDLEEKKEQEDLEFLPAEMSGIFISGHEVSKAQLKVFNYMKLTDKERQTVVETYYNGRENNLRTYQIKQDLFMKIINHDIDFLVEIMKATLQEEEKIVFEKYL